MRSLWSRRIAPFLTYFNTHPTCLLGIVVAFVSLGAIGGRVPLDAWASAHLDGISSLARAYIDGAATVALYAIWPGVIAAALGRPPNIPGGPTLPK